MSNPNYHGIAQNNAKVIGDFSDCLADRNREIEDLKEYIGFLEYFGKMAIDISDHGDEVFKNKFNYGDAVDLMRAFDVGGFI